MAKVSFTIGAGPPSGRRRPVQHFQACTNIITPHSGPHVVQRPYDRGWSFLSLYQAFRASIICKRLHCFVYLCLLVLHPRSNGTVISLVMDCEVRLRVQTVPASDPVTSETHTAYMVLRQAVDGGPCFHASGWTLRDAIDNFCKWFGVDRRQIRILRPFLPLRMGSYDDQ